MNTTDQQLNDVLSQKPAEAKPQEAAKAPGLDINEIASVMSQDFLKAVSSGVIANVKEAVADGTLQNMIVNELKPYFSGVSRDFHKHQVVSGEANPLSLPSSSKSRPNWR